MSQREVLISVINVGSDGFSAQVVHLLIRCRLSVVVGMYVM